MFGKCTYIGIKKVKIDICACLEIVYNTACKANADAALTNSLGFAARLPFVWLKLSLLLKSPWAQATSPLVLQWRSIHLSLVPIVDVTMYLVVLSFSKNCSVPTLTTVKERYELLFHRHRCSGQRKINPTWSQISQPNSCHLYSAETPAIS